MAFHLHYEEIITFLSGGMVWTILSYAIQSFPPQSNPYMAWLVGVAQYALANKEKGRASFEHAAGQVLQAKGQEVKEAKEAREADRVD